MEAIEKIMEVIRTKLSGYRVETTTVQEVPEPVMLITGAAIPRAAPEGDCGAFL